MCVCAGSGKAFDQNAIVHSIWMKLTELGCGAWIERVPTEANIADSPSRRPAMYAIFIRCVLSWSMRCRESYSLMETVGAERCAPVMDGSFMDLRKWVDSIDVLGLLY